MPTPNFTLRKFGTSGTLLLTRNVFDKARPGAQAQGLTLDTLGNVIVVASWFDLATFNREVVLYKYRPNLTRVWAKDYSTSDDEFGYDIATDFSNNIYFLVVSVSRGARYVKWSAAGTQLFSRRLEPASPAPYNSTPVSVTTDGSGNVYITVNTFGSFSGFTNPNPDDTNPTFDIVVFKYDANGTRLWVTQFGRDNYGSPRDDNAFGIAVSDAVYVTGSTAGNLLGGESVGWYDAFLAQLDLNNGQVLGVDQ